MGDWTEEDWERWRKQRRLAVVSFVISCIAVIVTGVNLAGKYAGWWG